MVWKERGAETADCKDVCGTTSWNENCDDVCISGDAHQKGNHLEQTPGSQVDRMRPSSLYLPPIYPRACSVVQEQSGHGIKDGGCVRATQEAILDVHC